MTQECTAACPTPPQYLTRFKLFTSTVLKTPLTACDMHQHIHISASKNIYIYILEARENNGKCSTCSEECFSLARLNLIRESCVVLRETFVQLGKSFRGDATTSDVASCPA